jgi:tellurite resistance protein
LIKLFGIERKTKSLSELGASDIQIEQNEVGRLAQKYGFETEEDFKEAQAALLEKKNRERKRNDAAEKNDYSDTSSMEHSPSMSQTSLDEMS